MAHPRVFISSTYFDLKNVRSDLERFVKEMGYDPILNEHGHIPYSSTEALEEYCYKEINNCDILISIIGGRRGSQSLNGNLSISNKELLKAIELGKQVYIFIDNFVHSEFKTYERNKKNDDIKYAAVDDPKIYEFIEEIKSLPVNNQIASFENTSDITIYLREQWSGLFQRLLFEESKKKEQQALEDIKSAAKTLEQLVTFLTNERKETDSSIRDILLSNHPAFHAIKSTLNIPFRIYFTNISELNDLLDSFGYMDMNIFRGDDDESDFEWLKTIQNSYYDLRINSKLFDNNHKLLIMTPEEWDDTWVNLTTRAVPAKKRSPGVPPPPPPSPPSFDDIDF